MIILKILKVAKYLWLVAYIYIYIYMNTYIHVFADPSL